MKKIASIFSSEIISGAVSAFAIKVFAALFGLLFNIIISRNLGAEEAGLFYLSQAVILFLANFVRQGMDNSIVRFFASYKVENNINRISGLFFYALKRILFFSFFISTILFVFSDFISVCIFDKSKLSSSLSIGALMIIPVACTYFISYCFQGVKNVIKSMLFQACTLVFLTVMSLYLLSPKTSSETMKIYFICSVVTMVTAFFLWRKEMSMSCSSLDFSEKKHFDKSANSLFLVLIMSELIQWSGQFFLGIYSSSNEVAFFSSAFRTSILVSFILLAVNSIAAPKFAEAYKKGDLDGIKNVSILSGRLMTVSAFPLILIMLIFAPYVMALFGEEFSSAANVLRILSLGQFVNVITGSVGYLLQMTGNESVLRNNLFFSLVILIILLFTLVPTYGAFGAAIATAVSISTQNLLCVYQVKRRLGFNTLALWS